MPENGKKLSGAELVKAASRRLRGTLAEELASDAPSFSKDATLVLKFHGIYQQHDRDLRRAEAKKEYSCMVRVSVPGGVLRPEQYLALHRLAGQVGDGTLRVTSRGGVQYHYVGKRSLRDLIRAINAAGLNTLAACGDVVRNVVCTAAPFDTPEQKSLLEWVRLVDRSLKPKTRAYAEIWLDGERAVSLVDAAEESEPLYGDTYLPRKFKIGFTREGDNTVDIYAHDLGFVAHIENGEVAGFTFLAGGGMGQTNGDRNTHPRLADPVGFIPPERVLDVARAVVSIHRDFGDRANRRHARLKYVIEERGLAWFREELARRLGWQPEPPRPLDWTRHADWLGWHAQDDRGERWFFGLRVVSGRLGGALLETVAEIVSELQPEVRFTPQQNLIFANLPPEARPALEGILRRRGAAFPHELPPVLRHSMACPALPTCGLALTDSERVLPDIAADIQGQADAAGAAGEVIHLRMTGCPNGCARPYTAEIGIVGQSPRLYSIYLGGSPLATRLAVLYSHNIPQDRIGAVLRPLLDAWVRERRSGESFGDFCHRAGVDALRERFLEVSA
ncbi:MAG: NADPH-dependent assimilatory sulfite reductase hemoprotein subunit [Bryobacteraceae bacterium]|nr:NADPH-dependent assimilatory sulfite reductase hemoprotein subunit [Bryobacteraceae bacterium]